MLAAAILMAGCIGGGGGAADDARCFLYAIPRDGPPAGWDTANLTEGFLDAWPNLRVAIAEGFVEISGPDAVSVVRAIGNLGATTAGQDEAGIRAFAHYGNQTYEIQGTCEAH